MEEVSPKRWILRPEPDSAECPDLFAEPGIPRPAVAVLWNRGVRTRRDAEKFLNPGLEDLEDPFTLPDMDAAVSRIRRAIDTGEMILTYGDYDVDGLTAVALWTRVLRRLNGRVITGLPNRMKDGYGLSLRAVETARERGASLLIASDCGTSDHQAIRKAAGLGLDVIVIDHHTPGPVLPQAFAVVNPKRPDSRYPFPDLPAVGVAFKALQALVDHAGMAGDALFLESHMDLVALGAVADTAPLVGENRLFVLAGLRVLRENPRPGILALLERAGLTPENLDTSNLAYHLAPRLNASGRLGEPARTLDLLMAEDPSEARCIAEAVEEDNRLRRALHERVLAGALGQITPEPSGGEDPIICASADWHPGVLGIAASRLAERFGRPALLISLRGRVARGSARTPPGIDLLEWIGHAGDILSAYGGHPQAVGLSLPPESYAQLRSCLLRHSGSLPRPAAADVIEVDGVLDPSSCGLPLARWLGRLAPFGRGNPEPLFVGRGRCAEFRVQHGRHLRVRIGRGAGGIDCIGFGMAGKAAELYGGAEVEMVYHPTVNRHRGGDRLQLKLREIGLGEHHSRG